MTACRSLLLHTSWERVSQLRLSIFFVTSLGLPGTSCASLWGGDIYGVCFVGICKVVQLLFLVDARQSVDNAKVHHTRAIGGELFQPGLLWCCRQSAGLEQGPDKQWANGWLDHSSAGTGLFGFSSQDAKGMGRQRCGISTPKSKFPFLLTLFFKYPPKFLLLSSGTETKSTVRRCFSGLAEHTWLLWNALVSWCPLHSFRKPCQKSRKRDLKQWNCWIFIHMISTKNSKKHILDSSTQVSSQTCGLWLTGSAAGYSATYGHFSSDDLQHPSLEVPIGGVSFFGGQCFDSLSPGTSKRVL